MPALFAYLIAVGLLLGGGYGALNWLTAPEPIKIVAKAKPKSPSEPHDVANIEPASSPASLPDPARSEPVRSEMKSVPSEENAPAGDNSEHVEAASSDQRQPQAEASELGATAAVSEAAQDQKTRLAHAEIPPAAADKEATQYVEAPPRDGQQEQEDRRSALATTPASPSNAQAATPAPPATVRPVKRRHLRQASHRSEKRPLALMTLRTIEFPDGRRMTQLFPYRGGERAMTFEPDE